MKLCSFSLAPRLAPDTRKETEGEQTRMPQGKAKFKKPVAIKKASHSKKQSASNKKKGLQKFNPKNPTLGYKLSQKLGAEIGRNVEKSTAEKYAKGGGTLSILGRGN